MNLDTSKPIKSVSYNGVDVPLDVAPKLLWTNASPTSNFAAQTISVNGSGYSGYIIESRTTSSIESTNKTFVNVNGWGVLAATRDTSTWQTTSRIVSSANSTSVSFLNGYSGTTGSPNYCIPTRIWGVKFTL